MEEWCVLPTSTGDKKADAAARAKFDACVERLGECDMDSDGNADGDYES